MQSLTEALTAWGCDSAAALDRYGDMTRYRQALDACAAAAQWDLLGAALRDGDTAAREAIAREMLEQTADLGLIPLWQETYPLACGCTDAARSYAALRSALREMTDILARY